MAYNRVLSATEVIQNCIVLRPRYGEDGSSSTKPAANAMGLRSLGITTDGVYWFSTRKQPTPFQAYVKFNYIDGSDWMLLLKVHNQGDLPSGSAYWTNSTLYNQTDFNLTSGTWSKYATWTGMPFTRLMMVMTQTTEKVPPIMIFDTSRTFAEAITLAGGASAAAGQNNIVKCTSTDPAIATSATYWNMTMKSGSAFVDAGGAEDCIQCYGIAMWANNSNQSTTAEGFSSVARAGAWIGCPLDEAAGHAFNVDSSTVADSGFGFGASAGNPAKTTSVGYNEWTLTNSTNTLPGYVWIR